MAKIRYRPKDFDQVLGGFAKTEENRIRQEYNRLYDERIKDIQKKADSEVIDVFSTAEKHESLRSMALNPFIENIRIMDEDIVEDPENVRRKEIFRFFELLFNDSLYFLKSIRELDEDIPTLDFIIGEFSDERRLVTLILGEIKGQKARYTTDSLKKIIEEYKKPEMLKKISNYIKKVLNKEEFEISEVQIEFALVVHTIDVEDYHKSIGDSNLPFKIWEIKEVVAGNQYSIVMDKGDELRPNPGLRYQKLRNFLRDNEFERNIIFDFTYATNLWVILYKVHQFYVQQFGKEITEDNLKEVIKQIGGGEFFDDERIMKKLMNSIIERGLEMNIIARSDDRLIFNRVIDVKKNILNYDIKNKIQDKDGKKILEEALKNLHPKTREEENIGKAKEERSHSIVGKKSMTKQKKLFEK